MRKLQASNKNYGLQSLEVLHKSVTICTSSTLGHVGIEDQNGTRTWILKLFFLLILGCGPQVCQLN